MTVYVALLRGINVGGNRKLAMADLRDAIAGAGGSDVATYIQSGNAVFRHPGKARPLTPKLEAAIAGTAGFDVPVDAAHGRRAGRGHRVHPFPTSEPTQLHVSFLDEPPPAGAFDAIDRAGLAPEDFALIGREVFLHLPNGIGRSKLPQALGLYTRHPATTRNWRTVVTLHDLAVGL